MLDTNVIHIMFTQLLGNDRLLTLSGILTEFQHLRKHLIRYPGLLDLLGFSGLRKYNFFTQSSCKRRMVYSWSRWVSLRWEARGVGGIAPQPLPMLTWLLCHSFKPSLLVPFIKALSQGHFTRTTTNSYFSIMSYIVTSLFINREAKAHWVPQFLFPRQPNWTE